MANNELVPLVIDLNEYKNKKLNETFLRMFGGLVQHAMREIFGYPTPPISVKGTKADIQSFMNVLGREKRYMEAFNKYGLGDEKTYLQRYKLEDAVAKFERETGIKWPLS